MFKWQDFCHGGVWSREWVFDVPLVASFPDQRLCRRYRQRCEYDDVDVKPGFRYPS